MRILLIWFLLVFPAKASSLHELVEKHSTIYNHTQIACISRAVYFEARGEPLQGQLAVAQVIMNRVAHKRYPKTPCAVINKEFSFKRSVTPRGGLWITANAIGYIAYNGLAEDLTFRSTHFHSIQVNPGWRFPFTVKIGNHKFYRID